MRAYGFDDTEIHIQEMIPLEEKKCSEIDVLSYLGVRFSCFQTSPFSGNIWPRYPADSTWAQTMYFRRNPENKFNS